jgi:hypothetical protein
MNFIWYQRAHHCLSPGKKKAPQGASRFKLRHELGRRYVNPLSFFVETVVPHDSVDLGEQRKVPTHTNVLSRVNACAKLSDNNIAGPHCFAAKHFNSPSLPLAVASVAGTSSGFLMGHF